MSADDEPFLLRVYGGTRDDLGHLPGLADEQRTQLVEFQYRAQQAEYGRNYDPDGHRIIELDGEPIGRLWLDRRADEFEVVDMALLPDRRRGGIGGLLFEELCAEADAAEVPLRLESLSTNRGAIAFAERHGFAAVSDDGVLVCLVREPR